MYPILNTDLFRITGWTIIHSAWEFLIVYAVLKLALVLIDKRNAQLRYLTCIFAMGAAVLLTVLTFNYECKLYFNSGLNLSGQIHAIKNVPVRQIWSYKFTGNIHTVTKHSLLNYLDAISPYLTFGWIAGMLFYMLKIVTGSVYLYKLRNLKSAFYPDANEKLQQLLDKMQLSKPIRLIINDAVTGPLTFGNIKPIILLPCSYVANVPPEQLEMILAHELAHIKRYDYLVNIVQTFLEAVFFFNPFFKYLSDMTRNEREYCCDDMASHYCGNEKTMAIALANLKILKDYPALSLSASSSQTIFHNRINRLIAPGRQSAITAKAFVLPAIIMALSFVYLTKPVNTHTAHKILTTLASPAKQVQKIKATITKAENSLLILNTPPPPSAIKTIPIKADTDTLHRQKAKYQAVVPASLKNNPVSVPATQTRLITDTAEYAARYYKVPENAFLNELLSKMEGFKVDSAGRIFHQGREINRFSINNNLLSAHTLPQNIPAAIVNIVRVSYTYSEPASGTLNIEIKKQ